jgi:hypothetical protein
MEAIRSSETSALQKPHGVISQKTAIFCLLSPLNSNPFVFLSKKVKYKLQVYRLLPVALYVRGTERGISIQVRKNESGILRTHWNGDYMCLYLLAVEKGNAATKTSRLHTATQESVAVESDHWS